MKLLYSFVDPNMYENNNKRYENCVLFKSESDKILINLIQNHHMAWVSQSKLIWSVSLLLTSVLFYSQIKCSQGHILLDDINFLLRFIQMLKKFFLKSF